MTRGNKIAVGVCVSLVLAGAVFAQPPGQPPPGQPPPGQPPLPANLKDPGVRQGPAGAGTPLPGLTASQLQYFNAGAGTFAEVEDVSKGLGPTFNLDSCGGCHAQPFLGGSSPANNPQIAVSSKNGALNKLPPFVHADGPAFAVRFRNVPGTNQPDGGVRGLFTIAGRADAPGCTLAQPDFSNPNNLSLRIPTPLFGAGLIESISDSEILENLAANSLQKQRLGINFKVNTSGNDGTITRFGWKAQNKSLLVFAGEAYNVELGVANELFPSKRSAVPGCVFSGAPEDATHTDAASYTEVSADTVSFGIFMRFLDAPIAENADDPVVTQGRNAFHAAGCNLCHTPALTTGAVSVAALSNKQANLYSDLAIHNMGRNLNDGVSQGNANGADWRTAPLWGLGKRIFLLHDGRSTDLVDAIYQHRGPGSEASAVVNAFDALPAQQQQAMLVFLRSL